MSTQVVSSYAGSAGLGTGIFVEWRNPISGTVLQARSNGGIREDRAGAYVSAPELSQDLDMYEAVWDEGDGVYYPDIFIPRPTVTVNITEGSPLPIVGDANADLIGKTFVLKRGDTKPILRRQLVDTNGTVIPLDGSETIKVTGRPLSQVVTGSSASPKFHASGAVGSQPGDDAQGIFEYQWAASDTDTATVTVRADGTLASDAPLAVEVEVTFADGSVETFPQAGYLLLTIWPDLDPGINP